MRVLTMITAFLLIPLGLSFGAQSPIERVIWNWAWRDATDELFAYSTDGETQLLLNGVTGTGGFWRVSDDQAFGLLEIDGGLDFYEVSPESAQIFTPSFETMGNFLPYRLEAYSYPYMLFTSASSRTPTTISPALLYNLETRHTDILTDGAAPTPSLGCCRYTEDGDTLRYAVISVDASDQTLVLRERILATGEEHTLYRFTDGYLELGSDVYGERWLLLTDSEGFDADGTLPYEIFNINGTSEMLTQAAFGSYTSYEFFGNDLIAYQPLCSGECFLRLLTPDGDSLTFELPDVPYADSIIPLVQIGDDLVIARTNDYWLLSAENEPLLIGYVYRGGSHLPPNISPDGRWLLVTDTDSLSDAQLMVWDLISQEVVLEFPRVLDKPVYMIYDADGFIVESLDYQSTNMLYRYSDERTFQLPDASRRIYFDVLPENVGGSVLYEQYGQPDTDTAGIYLYNPDDESSTSLIEDAQRVWTIDLDYYSFELSQR